MTSGFAHTGQLSGLSDSSTFSNLISTVYNKLRIVGRNPAAGMPAPGVPFSLIIEVQTSNDEDWFDRPFWCPDIFVVIRDANSSRVWASKYITTFITSECTGRDTLVFDPAFRPDSNSWVKIEMYKDDDVSTLADTSAAEPIAVSRAINFSLDLESGRGAGVYDDPTGNFLTQIGNSFQGAGFGGLNSVLTKMLIVAGAGVGLYFTAPLFPKIKSKFKDIAGIEPSDEDPDPKSITGLAKRAGKAAKNKTDKALKKIEKTGSNG